MMQASGHVGKLVIRPPNVSEIVVRQRRGFQVSADKLHLITGGFGGFGLEDGALARRQGRAQHPAGRAQRRGQHRGARGAGLSRRARRARAGRSHRRRRQSRLAAPVRAVRQGPSRARRRDPCRHGARRFDGREPHRREGGTRVPPQGRGCRQSRSADPRHAARLFHPVFLGHDVDRQSRPERLCGRQRLPRRPRPPPPPGGPARTRGRVGRDRGRRCAGAFGRDARRSRQQGRHQGG